MKAMRNGIINMWSNIWKMESKDFGGNRAYISDFEIYDERSADYNDAVVDVFIGVNR